MDSKDLFIKIMKDLERQYNKDIVFAEHMGMAFPNAFEANLLPENGILYDAVILLLKKISNVDEDDSMIEYYIWELDFGKKAKEYSINVDNSEKLWLYLQEN